MQVAIDYSSSEAIVCLRKEGVIFIERRFFKHREAGLLQQFLYSFFESHKVDVSQIDAWFVGIGPGSFTTLRLSVATVLGFAVVNPAAKVHGIPSALGMVQALPIHVNEVHVLYDGRNKEALYFGMKRSEKGWVPNGKNGVIALDQIDSLGTPLVTLEANRTLFTKNIASLFFIEYNSIECFFESLICLPATDLIYVRPAVFTQPIVLRDGLPI